MKYRYTGNERVFVPDINRVVDPGEEIATGDVVLKHNDFSEIKDRPERPAKEA